MHEGIVPTGCKQLSVLRRLGDIAPARWLGLPGVEGCASVFQLSPGASPIVVEAVSGRAMTIAPGDLFLGTAGYRESTRWVVGGVPVGGLVPGVEYWVLAECGIVGTFAGQSPLPKGHLGKATYVGLVVGPGGDPLRLTDHAVQPAPAAIDHGARVFLLVGTSSEVGKTSAGLAILRSLLAKGSSTVGVLKATGTSSVTELAGYLDFGAAWAHDCVDFGLATTFPSGRADSSAVFERALDVCLALPADAVLIECGGDILGGCVPEFTRCLRRRRAEVTTVLAASDPFGALGAQQLLQERGLSIQLITGRCCDTITSMQRTEAVCHVPARSMMAQADKTLAL